MSHPVVIIPSRNAANLVACLGALRNHEPDCPVIVVDDGVDFSTWDKDWIDSPLMPSDTDGNIRIIPGAKPFIFARNCNIGIRAAGDSDVVLLNDDALLESPGGFQKMQAAVNWVNDKSDYKPIGIMGATTNVTGQPLQYRTKTAGVNLPSWRYVPHIAFVCVYLPRCTINRLSSNSRRPDWFTGGLLDERYCLDYGCDDADYCEQVTRAGLKVAVHDGCYVDHASLTSTYRGDPRAAKSFAQNYKLLMEKWGKLESQPK